MAACPGCGHEVLDIDVKCPRCGTPLGSTGAQRMIGQTVLGQYELIDVLGQGGMSVVFKGKHKMTDQEVALKILPPELAAHSQVKSRFLDEAKALAALDHPNIVHLYNFGQEDGYFVLAMQFVAGRTWERLILENKKLDWKPSARICCDVLRALEYAHGRGVVHRDMKPSNVLVRNQDGSATVMDFGIAKMTTSTRLTATGQTMGTVRYMSPEQVRGQEVDFRTDIYSLGATLYESLTGDTPFDGNTHFEIMTKHLSEPPKRPSAMGVALPSVVEDVLMRSLAKRADDRFGSAREMRKLLEGALREADIGLVETQRLSREVLGDLRPTASSAKPVAQPPRASTPSELADQLEPGTSRAMPRGAKRSKLPWIALAVLVAGAGVTAGYLIAFRESGDAPYKQTFPTGVAINSHATIDGVVIETDGKLEPAQIASTYRGALAELHKFAQANRLIVADPLVDVIVSMPRDRLCDATLYSPNPVPDDCAERLSTAVVAPNGRKALLVVNETTDLAIAIAMGAARALCVFQSDKVPAEQAAAICEKTKSFIDSMRAAR